jgi:putative hydrolase of the HAD superfamily
VISSPLRSERLVIDRLVATDLAALVAYKNDPAVAEYQSWPMPFTDGDASALIASDQLGVRAGSDLVGDLMMAAVAGTDHAFEIGVTIAPGAQGRGYASEAVRTVAEAMFADARVRKLIAYVDVDNKASLRLFDRVGFRREGLLRESFEQTGGRFVDEVLFGLTRTEWSRADSDFDVIAFDADDTLWQSEDSFHVSERVFIDLITPYVDDGIDVKAALTAVERKNLGVFGYGVRAFGLSMVETATSLAGDRLPIAVAAELVEITRRMLTEPVHLLPGVGSVLEQVGDGHRLVLITKGDLIHQTHKVEASGLAHHFERIEIVLEKDPSVYARIVTELGVPPRRFCMVGNSVRSDILPVLAIGASAVHVPYHLLWDLEEAPQDHGHTFAELASLTDLPAWLTASTTAPMP